MRVRRITAAGVGLGVAVFCACAGTAPPSTPSPARHRVPHSCFGVEIRINPTEQGRFPVDVLREPEIGPLPLPDGQQDVMPSERPRGEWAAHAIVHAIKGAVPQIRCGRVDDRTVFHAMVECREEDKCHTTAQQGQAYVELIRPLITPMVGVVLDTCACRTYN